MFKQIILSTAVLMGSMGTIAFADNGKGKNKSVADVDVEYTSCNAADITSSKDISNIVVELANGEIIKIDDMSGHNHSLDMGSEIATIWVKSGNNKSGDGPGYGERFDASGGTATVEVSMTADDVQTTYINGVQQVGMNEAFWGRPDVYTVDVPSCEPIVVAVHARDVGRVAAAMIGTVSVDGNVVSTTGDGQWLVAADVTDTTWNQQNFDDSAWGPAQLCSFIPWGTYYQNIWGAEWVWHSTNCRDYRQVYYRLTIEP